MILDGSASRDPDGNLISYEWSVTDAPPRSSPEIADPRSPRTGFRADREGAYTISLVVRDGGMESFPDTAVVRVGGATAGVRKPGDCTADGGLDISDPVCLLGFLFLGSPARLPCGASAGDGANLTLLDVNGDGRLDLSDPVHLLGFLFLGGRPPVQGLECRPIAGCPEDPACR